MIVLRRWGAVIREALATTIGSPIVSAGTVVMVAGLCVTVLLTTGRTVGTEQAVLGSIDSAGSRAIVVTASESSGLTSDVLGRLANVAGIQWAGAFGPAVDARNTRIPDGKKVAVRLAYGSQMGVLGVPDRVAIPSRIAWATRDSLIQLGMPQAAGSITTQAGDDYAVAGQLELPDWLTLLQPALIVPQPGGVEGEIAILVVIAERPDLVAPVAAVVQSVLGADDPSKVTVTTSESIAQLRALIQGQLGDFGRGLVLLVLGISGALVALIMTGLVVLRRRDFGRRRALGATRGLIIGIVLTQTLCLASVGALLGTVGASIALLISGDPLPGLSFTVGVCVLAVAVSGVAALVPAVFASRRDPIRELRVP